MVKNIVSNQYPQRKSKFKKMVDRVRSKGLSGKKSKQLTWLNYSAKSNPMANWVFKDPERWNRFQKEFQGEFKEKMKLLDEIRDKKKENEVFYLIQLEDFINPSE
jgi:uncharacterized protein YeaO (DUF488 family)